MRQSNACVKRLNTQVSFSQHLPPGLQLKTVDLAAVEAAVRDRFAPLELLPGDLDKRLDRYCAAMRPSLWRRLIS